MASKRIKDRTSWLSKLKPSRIGSDIENYPKESRAAKSHAEQPRAGRIVTHQPHAGELDALCKRHDCGEAVYAYAGIQDEQVLLQPKASGGDCVTSQAGFSVHELSLLMKASQPPSMPGVAEPLPWELLLRVKDGPLVNSNIPPSKSNWKDELEKAADVTGGGLLELGVDMSKALGANVALMPSYDG